MHRGKVAHALLPQIAKEQEADVIIISEQYTHMRNGIWIEDESRTAAIWLPCCRQYDIKNSGKGNGYAWLQIDTLTIISCYLTPSDTIELFQQKLNEIEDFSRTICEDIIIAGDFNSRAVEWGMKTSDSRGRKILQMIARLGITTANVGNTATFRRPGCEGTIPDVTFVSEKVAHKVKDWRVLEIYTASDHQYISFGFKAVEEIQTNKPCKTTRRWNVNKLNTAVLLSEIDRRIREDLNETDARSTVQQIMTALTSCCNKAMPKLKSASRHKAVYWWNATIDEHRQNCIKTRRRYTRARRRGDAEAEHESYKEAKKLLQNHINKSKKDKWEELRSDINNNPWGLGYRVVMQKLGMRNSVEEMDEDTMQNIVNTLFPKHNMRTDDSEAHPNSNIRLFSIEELQTAARSLKNNKAPGPDGIPSEVIKEIAANRPNILLRMYNSCLREGIFPEIWKEQKLVLISKGKGDRGSPSSYRPLCMLDTAGKLLERLIKPRLEEAINSAGGLSKRQYGFRPGKSTMGALKDVINAVEAAQQGNHSTRQITLLATLDVKNAFNSLKWTDVIQALEIKFNTPKYLMRIIKDYLKNRVLSYNTKQGIRSMQVTSGAAQGSILGPDLWNASYDEILKIEMPEDTFLVGYADDIAAVIKARSTDGAQRKLRQVMIRTKNWLDSHGLQLAMHKTELLLLTRRHIPIEIDMHVGDLIIPTKTSTKYLGIRLDPKLTYSKQIEYATTKAAKVTSQLGRLMANVGGPLASRRKLLMEASNSILLYGSEIWSSTLKTKKRARKILAIQRTAALRVTSAYRTVSAQAALVIAGMIPIDLQAMERQQIFEAKQHTAQPGQTATLRQETVEKWQTRWLNEKHGRWTHKLIPDIHVWVNRRSGEVNYFLTQMLSGHGYFRKYLYNMGKCNSPFCIYEEEDTIDDAEHTFFYCSRWAERRSILETDIGVFSPTNITHKMISSEDNWNKIRSYVEHVLRSKKPDIDAAA